MLNMAVYICIVRDGRSIKMVYFVCYFVIYSVVPEKICSDHSDQFSIVLCDNKRKFTDAQRTSIVLESSGCSAAVRRKFLLKYEVSGKK